MSSDSDVCDTIAPSGDISGRGVRLSFYIQGACLIVSALYSQPTWRMVGTSAPFALTGILYAICTMALGFKPDPEITIYDAVVATSLGGISLLSALTLMLIFYLKHDNHSKVMRTLIGGQALVLVISAILVTYAIPNFGLHAECFTEIYWAFFGKIPIDKFRLINLIFYAVYLVAIICFIFFRFKDHIANWAKSKHEKATEAKERKRQLKKVRIQNASYMTATLIVSGILYAIIIVYVEVLRAYNRVMMAQSDGWSFGQITAFALCIVPFLDTIEFIRRHRRATHSWDPMRPMSDQSAMLAAAQPLEKDCDLVDHANEPTELVPALPKQSEEGGQDLETGAEYANPPKV